MNTPPDRSEFGVGVKILDMDHRELTETFSALHAAANKNVDRGQISILLQKLADFTLTHFALEEGMMAATRYPKLALHRQNHRRIIRRIKEIAAQYKHRNLVLEKRSLSFLAQLHHTHVHNDDLHYSLWLNTIGRD